MLIIYWYWQVFYTIWALSEICGGTIICRMG